MKKNILRFFLFSLLVFVLGTALIYATSNIRFNQKTTILAQITGNPVRKGEGTFLKFYEAENLKKKIDILVIGSSRAFRAFDPLVFEENNINIHVLASSSQTPLNTYYLLEKYLPLIKPKMVILDVHLGLLNNNGLECLYDLCVNTPISMELFEMAAAVDQPNAYTTCYASLINQLDTPLYRNYKFKPPRDYRSGFIADSKSDSNMVISKGDTIIQQRELTKQEKLNLLYIGKIITFVKSRNTDIVLTRQPVYSPENGMAQKRIIEMVKQNKIKYINLNRFRKQIDPRRDLFDKNHLNSNGARIVSQQVIKSLQKMGYKF
jgi:hypothetical protein